VTHRRRSTGTAAGTRPGTPGRPAAGDRGATAAEYAIVVSLVAVVVISGVAALGQAVLALFAVPGGL